MPKGFRHQAPYSSRLDYGLLLIYLTGKFSYLSITISWAWGVEKTILKKKSPKKLKYIDVVIETVICFFLSLCFGIQFGRRFFLKTTYKCQILFSAARVVEKKIKFRETAITFKIITCERLSEVKSTFSTVVSFHLFRFGRFVSLVSFWSFRFAVSGLSTCRNYKRYYHKLNIFT